MSKEAGLSDTPSVICQPSEIIELGIPNNELSLTPHASLAAIIKDGEAIDVITDGERYPSGKWRVSRESYQVVPESSFYRQNSGFDIKKGDPRLGTYRLAQPIKPGALVEDQPIHIIVGNNFSAPYATLDSSPSLSTWHQNIQSLHTDTPFPQEDQPFVDYIAKKIEYHHQKRLEREEYDKAQKRRLRNRRIRRGITALTVGITLGVTGKLGFEYWQERKAADEAAEAELQKRITAFDNQWRDRELSEPLVNGELNPVAEDGIPEGTPGLHLSGPKDGGHRRQLEGYGIDNSTQTIDYGIVRSFQLPDDGGCIGINLRLLDTDKVSASITNTLGSVTLGPFTEEDGLQVCWTKIFESYIPDGHDQPSPTVAIQINDGK